MQLANIKLISQHHFLVRGQAKTTCPEPIVLKRKKVFVKLTNPVCQVNSPETVQLGWQVEFHQLIVLLHMCFPCKLEFHHLIHVSSQTVDDIVLH